MNKISRNKILEALDFDKKVELRIFKDCLLNDDIYTDILVIYKKSRFKWINKLRALYEVDVIKDIYGFESLKVTNKKDFKIIDCKFPLFHLFLYLFGPYGELTLVNSDITEYNKTILPKNKCIKKDDYNLRNFHMENPFIYDYINNYSIKDLLKDRWLLVWIFNMSDLVSKYGYNYKNFKKLEFIKEKEYYEE